LWGGGEEKGAPSLFFIQIGQIDQWLRDIRVIALFPYIHTFLKFSLSQIIFAHIFIQQPQVIYDPCHKDVLSPLQSGYKDFQCPKKNSKE